MTRKRCEVIDAHVLVGKEVHLSLDVDELLRRMDAHGVDLAVARLMGPELVVENIAGNRRLLRASSRIKAMVTVNPWFGERGIEELERSFDLGAVGLFLHPARQGFSPTEPIAEPLIEKAVGLGWPIAFHTGTFIYSDILAVAEIARRFPETDFIAGFGGFSDMWFELPAILAGVENLFLDVSLIWGDAVRQIISDLGSRRVLFGSGEPRNRYSAIFKRFDRLGLTHAEEGDVFSENARRVFGLQ